MWHSLLPGTHVQRYQNYIGRVNNHRRQLVSLNYYSFPLVPLCHPASHPSIFLPQLLTKPYNPILSNLNVTKHQVPLLTFLYTRPHSPCERHDRDLSPEHTSPPCKVTSPSLLNVHKSLRPAEHFPLRLKRSSVHSSACPDLIIAESTSHQIAPTPSFGGNTYPLLSLSHLRGRRICT